MNRIPLEQTLEELGETACATSFAAGAAAAMGRVSKAGQVADAEDALAAIARELVGVTQEISELLAIVAKTEDGQKDAATCALMLSELAKQLREP